MDSSAFTSDSSDYSPSDDNANWAAINALKTALASSMVGISTNDIVIDSITSGARRRLSITDANRTPASGSQRQLSSTCVISYTINFSTTDVGYTDAAAAYVVLTNELQKALSSGSFATTLSLAAQLYNAGDLAFVTISVMCVTSDPSYCSLVTEPQFKLVTMAPTHQPTFRPTGAFSADALNNWTPYKTSLVAGIGGFLLLFIPCMIYLFRHQLPFVPYKRRDTIDRQRVKMEKRAAQEDLRDFGGRIEPPKLIVLDDLISAYDYSSSSSSGGSLRSSRSGSSFASGFSSGPRRLPVSN